MEWTNFKNVTKVRKKSFVSSDVKGTEFNLSPNSYRKLMNLRSFFFCIHFKYSITDLPQNRILVINFVVIDYEFNTTRQTMLAPPKTVTHPKRGRYSTLTVAGFFSFKYISFLRKAFEKWIYLKIRDHMPRWRARNSRTRGKHFAIGSGVKKIIEYQFTFELFVSF